MANGSNLVKAVPEVEVLERSGVQALTLWETTDLFSSLDDGYENPALAELVARTG